MRLGRIANQDRRRWKRQWVNTSVRVLTDTAAIDALGLKLSEGGMYLFAVADLPVGSQIKIEFPAPRSKELVEVHATIRNRAVYLYGVEFLQAKRSSWLATCSECHS